MKMLYNIKLIMIFGLIILGCVGCNARSLKQEITEPPVTVSTPVEIDDSATISIDEQIEDSHDQNNLGTVLAPTEGVKEPLVILLNILLENIEVGTSSREEVELLLGQPVLEVNGEIWTGSQRQLVKIYNYKIPQNATDLMPVPTIRIAYKEVKEIQIVNIIIVTGGYSGNYTAEMLINAYGRPSFIHATSCGYPGSCAIVFGYPAIGLEFSVERQSMWVENDQLSSGTPLSTITLFEPMSDDNYRTYRFETTSEELNWDTIWQD